MHGCKSHSKYTEEDEVVYTKETIGDFYIDDMSLETHVIDNNRYVIKFFNPDDNDNINIFYKFDGKLIQVENKLKYCGKHEYIGANGSSMLVTTGTEYKGLYEDGAYLVVINNITDGQIDKAVVTGTL